LTDASPRRTLLLANPASASPAGFERGEPAVGKLAIRFEGNVCFLTGEFDMAEVEDFEAATRAHFRRNEPIFLDLSELRFMDSTGYHAIVRLAERLRCPRLVIQRPHRAVARILELTRIEQVPGIVMEGSAGRPTGAEGEE
jgi:anti-anti-sigma factor